MNKNPMAHDTGVRHRRDILLIVILSAGYLLLSFFLIGYKPEQIILVLLFAGFYFASPASRKFIIGFSVFILYWIVFDYMKAFPNYRYNTVHLADLYGAEKKWFGLSVNGTRITPNEYWLRNGNSFLDVLTGVFYLTWVPVPLIFAVYLFYRDRRQFFYFALTFFLVNILGFIIYYAYPAAPPWYIQQHGFVFYPGTPGNTAGLTRFDHFFHMGIFKSIYAKSSNVFAAMPSLHSSYPLIVLYFGLKKRMGRVNILFAVIMSGIWFSAIYNSHHYVLDVLAGIACALTGILLFQILLGNKFIRLFVEKWLNATL
jgi:hypothetical protein